MTTALLPLTAGPMRLVLSPHQGGSIYSWTRDEIPLLRVPYPGIEGSVTVREHGSYPMIPFAGRIAHGRFHFAGQDYVLPRDKRDTHHALHGNALYAPWDVVETGQDFALLRLASSPTRQDLPFFPFAYEAEQRYSLTPSALKIDLRLRNTGSQAFPAGFGHHLYFMRRAETFIRFQAGAMWETDTDILPESRTLVWRQPLASTLSLNAADFDNCFEDWNGVANITYPQQGYALKVEASALFGHAVLFTPDDTDYFAFEPVTHLNNAVNHKEPLTQTGLKILEPGEIMEGTITVAYEPGSHLE